MEPPVVTIEPKSSCCSNHYPRIPYTHTQEACDKCESICDEPGLGSSEFKGGNMNDCPLCCIPCTLISDIICCIPMLFGCYNIKRV